MSTEASPAVRPYTIFEVTVRRIRQLTPSVRLFTFTGPALTGFATGGNDQRCKIFFPRPERADFVLPAGGDWYQAYLEMDPAVRPPMRTYTIRRFDPERREVDVEFVLHGDTGPASYWALRAEVGDPVAICGPDARHFPVLGNEFCPPEGTDYYLLCGDETALPAMMSIVDALGPGERAVVYAELPEAADAREVRSLGEVEVHWLPRQPGQRAGEALLPAVTAAPLPEGVPYAWLAGESGLVKRLRRHLVQGLGVDRKRVFFSGYWRVGEVLE
ncbi:NADPH-dependent ferric siderophore reductase [Crossiella equi]|uniref:NADPH-dependent ferric siderophore reductase n=1 Tax=Crossiella equi TaxID=130796 RepID=A0ABS5A8H5_9PSEU|nr:siderophore-interacting protein [Crossiella equi]MBP2472524.1 NADPH-dependent ferric siderophore reductase [Crossiella equi]